MAQTFQRVSWRSLNPNSSGPKPIENVHAYAAPAGHQEMAELVEKYDYGQYKQERNDAKVAKPRKKSKFCDANLPITASSSAHKAQANHSQF